MTTTVYGTVQYDDAEDYYTRVGCTYDITSTDDSKTFSGTLFWQHKGSAKTENPYMPTKVYASLRDNTVVMDQTIVATDGVSTIAKHTDWTTIASKPFSITYNCMAYAKQIKVTGSVYEWFPGYDLEILIDMPPLPSWDVTYDGNGGTNVPSAQVKYKNIDLVLSSSKPSRANYDFYHWNTQPNNSGTTYEPGATYTDNATLTLYAIWNAQVRYNMNGGVAPSGSGLAGTQKKTYGVNLTLLTAVPTRTGYVFDGWNTAADGTGTAFQPGGTYSAEISVTLYAQWLSLPAKPSIPTMTAIRWNETTDQQDDTGTSAKVTAGWSIDTTSEYYGNTNTGTVTLTVTPQSGSSSHTITPVSGTSGTSGTAVFMVSGLDTDMQYTCKVTVTDLNASSERSVILTRAFFIMDFKAGGQGIGIGRAAPSQGLEVGYETVFDDDVTVYDGIYTQDSTGFVFPMMRYNGSNMWYGAIDSSHQSFKGYTYISTGYNGSAGYPSIRVAIPKANNSGSNLYDVWNANHSPINYATCTTAATAQVKVATVYPTTKTFLLTQGVVVGVKFTNTNTYSATTTAPCQLNVNGTGAKNIYWANTATPTGTNTTAFGRANYINYYMYDGTYWVWLSSSTDNNTTYSTLTLAEVNTGTSTATRVVTPKVIKDAIGQYMVGEIKMYAGATIPTGWLLCDGSEVLIEDYPLLNNALGGNSNNDVAATLWGTASDSDHFVLPNFVGRMPLGASDINTTEWVTITGENEFSTFTLAAPTYARWGTGDTWLYKILEPGDYSPTYTNMNELFGGDPASGVAKCLQVALNVASNGGYSWWRPSPNDMPTHLHSQPSHTHYSGLYTAVNRFGSGSRDAAGAYTGYGNAVYTGGASPNTNNAGGGRYISQMPPFAVVNYIICAV